MENSNIELIRGHMDTIILRTLQDDDKYGLEMLNEIRSLSEDLYSLKQPTLYSSLKRLEKQGYITSYPGSETKGANRTYYSLTEEGRQFLEADQKQWEFSRTIIDKLLSDKQFDKNDTPPFDPSEFRPATKREKREKVEPKIIYKYIRINDDNMPDDVNEEDIIDNINDINMDNAEIVDFPTLNKEDNIECNETIAKEDTTLIEKKEKKSSVEIIDGYVENNNSRKEEYACFAPKSNDYEDDRVVTNDVVIDYPNIEDSAPPTLDDKSNIYVYDTDNFEDFDKPKTVNEVVTNDTVSENMFNSRENIIQDEVPAPTYDNDTSNNDFVFYNVTREEEITSPTMKQSKPNHNDYLEYSKKTNSELNIDNNVDYISAFEDMYSVQNTVNDAEYTCDIINNALDDPYSDVERQFNEVDMNELKNTMKERNITLKPYFRNNTVSFYSGNFYYSNKLLRDWSFITYFMYAAFILISFACASNVGMQLSWTLAFLFTGMLLPIACLVNWKLSPLHKKRTNFVITNTLLTSFIVMVGLTVIIVLTGFFLIKIDASNPVEYVPAIVIPCVSLILIPISVLIYAVLYNQKHYKVGR